MIYLIQSPGFYVKTSEPRPMTFDERMKTIMIPICVISEIPLELLKSGTRKRDVVIWRQIAMWAAMQKCYGTLKEVGVFFGGRDHSTVIHAKDTINDLIDCRNKQVLNNLKSLEAYIGIKYNSFKK